MTPVSYATWYRHMTPVAYATWVPSYDTRVICHLGVAYDGPPYPVMSAGLDPLGAVTRGTAQSIRAQRGRGHREAWGYHPRM